MEEIIDEMLFFGAEYLLCSSFNKSYAENQNSISSISKVRLRLFEIWFTSIQVRLHPCKISNVAVILYVRFGYGFRLWQLLCRCCRCWYTKSKRSYSKMEKIYTFEEIMNVSRFFFVLFLFLIKGKQLKTAQHVQYPADTPAITQYVAACEYLCSPFHLIFFQRNANKTVSYNLSCR